MTKGHGSSVWAEFEKIAADSKLIETDLTPKQEFIANRKKEVPTGDDYTRNPKTEEYDVTKEEGKDLVEKAHKEDAQMASAMGKGGLVENIVQQQEKDIEVALKMPTGTLPGIHASVVSNLIKLANELDEAGKEEASKRVDAAIREIKNLPFDYGHLRKEAIAPAVMAWGIAALFGAGATGLQVGLSWFTSTREGLATDAQDLLEVLEKASDESPSAAKAANLLTPFVFRFNNINFSDENDIIKFKETVQQFGLVLGQIQRLVNAIELERGEKRWYWLGFDIIARVQSHMTDLIDSLTEAKKKIGLVEQKGQQVETNEQQVVQETNTSTKKRIIDFKMGDELDQQTAEKMKKLEIDLTNSLADDVQDDQGKPYNFVGRIVDNSKLIMEPTKILRIIELTNKINTGNH
jgi:hypothetical protein